MRLKPPQWLEPSKRLMDAADLRIFEAVARLGGMHKAAAELNTVQSNVTARIRVLEEELGLALFRRHSRGVVLTHAGQRLLPYAIKIAAILTEAKRAVMDSDEPSGPLAIGSLETRLRCDCRRSLLRSAVAFRGSNSVSGSARTPL